MPYRAILFQGDLVRITESPRTRPPELYPAQQAGVEKFLQSEGGRLLLCYGTGCGKTPTAITCITSHWAGRRREGIPHVLVVCPAMVRRHWAKEFVRWANVRCALPIEMGRGARGGTKAQRQLRDQAYESPIQITSYDLLPHIRPGGWDYIVFDEIHHLGDPSSQQSRRAFNLLCKNNGVFCLGLSATLIPTNLRQVWNPLRLLFGHREWGYPSRTGGISWKFAEQYCGITRNDYGAAVGKGIPERLPELRERIEAVAHQVQRRDIAADMPALNLRILEQPGEGFSLPQAATAPPSHSVPFKAALQWLKELASDITHTVVLVYRRDLATALANALSKDQVHPSCVFHIDGSMDTGKRSEILEQAEQAPRATLIATSESLREGIRLMWAQQVLFAEWRQSPAQVLQVLGRFQSVGDTRRPMVDLLVDSRLHGEANTLIERVQILNSVLSTDSLAKEIPDLLRPAELSEKTMADLTLEMFATSEAHALRSAFTEEAEAEVDD